MSFLIVRNDLSVVEAEFIRPRAWIESLGLVKGARIDLAVPELGIDGLAEVTAVRDCPPIAEGEGRVVTGRFVTRDVTNVVRITLATGTEIRATDVHPFWSIDREDWVPAGKLGPGERVDTLEGPVAVASVEPLDRHPAVYNLEVHGEHVYRVAVDGVLVHNAGPEYVIGTYSNLRKLATGTDYQVHHLIERRFKHLFGQSMGEMISQTLSRVNHQAFTNAWRNAIPYGHGTKIATREEVLAQAKIIYANFPDILTALGLTQ